MYLDKTAVDMFCAKVRLLPEDGKAAIFERFGADQFQGLFVWEPWSQSGQVGVRAKLTDEAAEIMARYSVEA